MAKYVKIPAPNGTAWIKIVEGEVTHHNSQRWSETQVHSSGGGGYVGPEGGRVNAPQVRSTAIQHQQTEFWIREVDGTEHQFKLMASDFPVAPGHKVRFAWGGNINKDKGDYLFAHNFNARQTWDFKSGKWDAWCSEEKLVACPNPGCLSGCALYTPIVCIIISWYWLFSGGNISIFDATSLAHIGALASFVAVGVIKERQMSRRLKSYASLASLLHQQMFEEFKKEM